MATIRQIAKAAGVSAMTVSFVLNDKPGQVSEETRQRVLRTVREMGYRPGESNRRQKLTVGTLGIARGNADAVPNRGGYFGNIISSIQNYADDRGYNLMIYNRRLFREETHKTIRNYLDGHCDGLAVLAPNESMPLVPALAARGAPFVVVGSEFEDSGVPYVDVDNIGAMRIAVSHLVSLGHRRIAFVGGADFIASANRRRLGYRLALEADGLAYDPELDSGPLIGEFRVHDYITDLFARVRENPPTGIVCWNDTSAVRVLNALRDLRIDVPNQVSVIGLDDDESSRTSDPPLTTLRQPYREIGKQAVEILIERIADIHGPVVQRLLPVRLIERDSTAPVER